MLGVNSHKTSSAPSHDVIAYWRTRYFYLIFKELCKRKKRERLPFAEPYPFCGLSRSRKRYGVRFPILSRLLQSLLSTCRVKIVRQIFRHTTAMFCRRTLFTHYELLTKRLIKLSRYKLIACAKIPDKLLEAGGSRRFTRAYSQYTRFTGKLTLT